MSGPAALRDRRSRPLIETAVERLAWPDPGFFDRARAAPPTIAAHDELAAVAALTTLELRQPAVPVAWRRSLRVVAWNLERCKYIEASAQRLREAAADVCLLSEMDLGMARSGNRHPTAELAARLGMGYAFGTEFIELGLGDEFETRRHAGTPNLAGLHGNAVLSGLPLGRAVIIPLDAGGEWFREGGQNDQRRVGGRMALACRIDLGNAGAWFVSVHFESRLTPEDRAAEMAILIGAVDRLAGDEPVLLGGDFNALAMPDFSGEAGSAFADPSGYEPLFGLASRAGFSWRPFNTADPTLRDRPDAPPKKRIVKIDWFFGRGLEARAASVIPALDQEGRPISDHDGILVEVARQGRTGV